MTESPDTEAFVPDSCAELLEMPESELKSALPDLAKDGDRMADVEQAVRSVPSSHAVHNFDVRDVDLDSESVDLIVTSPPYFDLKEYGGEVDGQLGSTDEYGAFSEMLDEVWELCYDALVPGGRMCVVVGDVLRSRSQHGRHRVLPLHATIQEHARKIGFDALAPIIWHKIGNATLESGDNARFLGKPYEPGAVVKNDIEYILVFRKPGGYRSPSTAERVLSVIDAERHRRSFRQVWDDISGEQRGDHPAPYPAELAERLIRMFSFVGDTVFDPFAGTGSTAVAAARCGRDSISVEIEEEYAEIIENRIGSEQRTLTTYQNADAE